MVLAAFSVIIPAVVDVTVLSLETSIADRVGPSEVAKSLPKIELEVGGWRHIWEE